jgi:endonuclease V-like protein UPF0215 family
MKPHVRIIGIDDAPFNFKDGSVLVVGTIVRLPNYLEGVMKTEIQVDGTDSTEKLGEMFNSSKYSEQLELIMLDGIALGGFNIVNLRRLHNETGIPVCTITRDRPDMDSIKKALENKFEDWKERWSLIKDIELVEVETEHKSIYVSHVGIELDDLKGLIRKSTVLGALPEPIRIAHLIASAMKTGESYGRA